MKRSNSLFASPNLRSDTNLNQYNDIAIASTAAGTTVKNDPVSRNVRFQTTDHTQKGGLSIKTSMSSTRINFRDEEANRERTTRSAMNVNYPQFFQDKAFFEV